MECTGAWTTGLRCTGKSTSSSGCNAATSAIAWQIEVVRPQSGFDVSDGDPIVEAVKRAQERAFRIALHHDRRPRLPGHHHIERAPAPGAEIRERGAAAGQRDIRSDVETRK